MTAEASKLAHTTVRKEWEARYVSEYLLEKFPEATTMHRVPLGSIPDELKETHGPASATKWFRPNRPVADAIAVFGRRLFLIEGKIFDPNRAIGQLLFYSRLLQATPELKDYRDFTVIMQLVTARAPPWASRADLFPEVQIVVYQPAWIQDYYEHLQTYWTAEKRQGRITRKQVLTSLGYG